MRPQVDVAVVDALGRFSDDVLGARRLGRGRQGGTAAGETGGEDAITAGFDGGQY